MKNSEIDMTGWVMKEHGILDSRLTVLGKGEDHIQPSGQRKKMWIVQCDCGSKPFLLTEYRLKYGVTLSCGCLRKEKSRDRQLKNHQQYLHDLEILNIKNYPLEEYKGANTPILHHFYKCGHECSMQPTDIKSGVGCPICDGKRVLVGYNDFASKHPELVDSWHPTKNGDLTPYNVTGYNNKKIWWVCLLGHEWQTTIYDRARGSGCPVCSGKTVLPGFNDLATLNPILAAEWNHAKNGDLKPTDVTQYSNKKVWWKCDVCGCEWITQISNRTAGTGCPNCKNEKHTSMPEQAIFYYLRQSTTAFNRFTTLGKEIDIYLPELKIGVEYNGSYYHDDKTEKDQQKIDYFNEKGITIITVCDGNENQTCNNLIMHKIKDIDWAIKELYNLIKLPSIDIDVKRDMQFIYAQYLQIKYENSFASKFPEKAKEWDYEKNGNITPDMVSYGSKKEFWRICPRCKTSYLVPIYRWCANDGCYACSTCAPKAAVLIRDNAIYKQFNLTKELCEFIGISDSHIHRYFKTHRLPKTNQYYGYEVWRLDEWIAHSTDNIDDIVKLQEDSMNKIKGVYFNQKSNKWNASITIKYKNIHLGSFTNKNDAIKARLCAEAKYLGKFSPQLHLFAQYGITQQNNKEKQQ